mmetsp:Transcript_26859/g.55558  ORF Transcript_26859/g.55558 Transcript_26859/m.55558 type:complete len:322 (+) Transcript_26859:4832-5797(+)
MHQAASPGVGKPIRGAFPKEPAVGSPGHRKLLVHPCSGRSEGRDVRLGGTKGSPFQEACLEIVGGQVVAVIVGLEDVLFSLLRCREGDAALAGRTIEVRRRKVTGGHLPVVPVVGPPDWFQVAQHCRGTVVAHVHFHEGTEDVLAGKDAQFGDASILPVSYQEGFVVVGLRAGERDHVAVRGDDGSRRGNARGSIRGNSVVGGGTRGTARGNRCGNRCGTARGNRCWAARRARPAGIDLEGIGVWKRVFLAGRCALDHGDVFDGTGRVGIADARTLDRDPGVVRSGVEGLVGRVQLHEGVPGVGAIGPEGRVDGFSGRDVA